MRLKTTLAILALPALLSAVGGCDKISVEMNDDNTRALSAQGQRLGTHTRPNWVDNPGMVMPEDDYIAAVGGGDTDENARRIAAARIAQTFRADVSSQEQLFEEYFESDGPDGGAAERKSTVSKQVELTTDQTLRNLQFPKSWQDPKTGRYYVLAGLDRAEATRIYTKDLAELEASIDDHFGAHRAETDKLTRLAHLDRALMLALERDMLAGQLRIVSRGARDHLPGTTRTDLSAARSRLRSETAIALDMSDAPEAMRHRAAGLLEEYGFRIADTDADYRLRGGLDISRLEREGFFYGWRGWLELSEASGAAILSCDGQGREGQLNWAEAERRALNAGVEELGADLRARLDAYLAGLLGGG